MILRLALLLLPLVAFGQDSFSVVNAADFRSTVAPSSLATIFGAGLTDTTLQGVPDESGRFPTELGGTTVSMNGTPVELLYVSPGQINLVVPATLPATAVEVLITRSNLPRLSGSATVRLVAPAVFTTDSSGVGEGAILNAVTFAGPPFLVRTPENPPTDTRTRMAIYANGFRWAGNPDRTTDKPNVASKVTAKLTTEEGLVFNLVVEYAGAAPGFVGLDQINVVLPPEADGGGECVLELTADGVAASPVTVRLDFLPEDAIAVASLELTPAQVDAGADATGKVVLAAPARRTNFAVTLSSDDATAVRVPSLVSVPAGQASQTFQIRTTSVNDYRDVVVTASGGGRLASASLRLRPANAVAIASLQLSATSTAPSSTINGIVTLNRAAGAGGVTVNLSSTLNTVQVPATVQIPFGASTAAFQVTAAADASGSATIRAELQGQFVEQKLDIRLPLTLELSKKVVVGGSPVDGTVAIAGQTATSGTLATLQSSNLSSARVPASVTIPAGSSSATFPITTQSLSSDESVTITAQSGNQQATAELQLEAETYGIEKLTLDPDTVAGGGIAVLSITIRQPVPVPALITLFSDNMAVARTPISLVLSRGTTTAKVNVTTRRVLTPTTVEITATYSGVSKSVKLNVN